MLRLRPGLLLGGLVLLAPAPALACRIGPPQEYTVDASLSDVVPPGPVELVDVTVDRQGGDGCTGSNSCSDVAAVYIALSAEDDETPSDSLGYVFSLVDGDAAPLPPTVPLAASDGVVTFHVVHDGGAIRYDLEVRAVDRAGNVGPATLVQVRNGTGCTIGGQASSAMPALLALAFLALRRRRR